MPRRILIQLDSDSYASVFDAVVGVDSDVEHLLQYASVDSANVVPLVHGAIFTRGPDALRSTAIFVGGSDVAVGDEIGQKIRGAFFGPLQVSVMLDGNGANTTAAAAVLCAARHVDLSGTRAIVLGGTGPVGGRVARLLLQRGSEVYLASRSYAKAEAACQATVGRVGLEYQSRLHPLDQSQTSVVNEAMSGTTAIFGCGAAGVELLSTEQLSRAECVRVAVDLNAVPPSGIAGIAATDKAVDRDGRIDYGAIGVGGLKMKIHRAAIQQLFTRNDLFLDTDEIYEIGLTLV